MGPSFISDRGSSAAFLLCMGFLGYGGLFVFTASMLVICLTLAIHANLLLQHSTHLNLIGLSSSGQVFGRLLSTVLRLILLWEDNG